MTYISSQRFYFSQSTCLSEVFSLAHDRVHCFAYVCMYVCMYVCTYVCMYVCTCVCTSEIPSAPIGLRVKEVTSSSLQVSWSAPASDGGTSYIVPVGVR